MPAYTCICSNGDGKLPSYRNIRKKNKAKKQNARSLSTFFFTYLVCNINLNSRKTYC